MSEAALSAPSTIRVRADHDQLRPDGRWARLLRALEAAPADVSELLEATDQGRYPRWRERRKIRTALFDMGNLGWVKSTDWGWMRTADGAEAFARISPATLDATDVRIELNPRTEA